MMLARVMVVVVAPATPVLEPVTTPCGAVVPFPVVKSVASLRPIRSPNMPPISEARSSPESLNSSLLVSTRDS